MLLRQDGFPADIAVRSGSNVHRAIARIVERGMIGRPIDPQLIWALPVAFVVHDTEELLTMPRWLAAHRPALHAMLQELIGTPAVPAIETPSVLAIALAMLALLAMFVAAAAFVALMPRNRIALFVYTTFLGAFFFHGFMHLGQTALFGGYTPGVVTAALVVIPVSLYLYRQLQRRSEVTRSALISSACVGAVLLLPGILLAFAIGRAAAR